MPCFSPLTAYRHANGDIVFVERGDIVATLQLPCGRCVGCRLERSRQWAVRIMHEAKCHSDNSFVTLTYRDECLPDDLSLDHSHFQLFFKRLRRYVAPRRIRYYMCGEYGDERLRPHFHCCIFGYLPDDLVLHSRTKDDALYTSAILSELWGRGFVSVGELTFKSAAYVARYVMKKQTGPQSESHYMVADPDTGEVRFRRPEYNRMSLKPGVGATWFKRFQSDVYPHDHVIVNGREAKPPRYYDKLFSRVDPDAFEDIQFRRHEAALMRADDNTDERLRVKETIAKRRVSDFLSRRLK